ncbi:MAG: hypothetical protein LLG08_00540 [Actinomycetia bacterium]|nr:hypothetical protein [Actinomycetes bacterium]
MAKCPACGKVFSVYRARTTGPHSQNHHLRGHVRQLAEHTGYSMGEMMEVVKQETVGWPTHELRGHTVWASEADIDSLTAAEAIERCHVIAVDLGVVLREQ